MKIGIFHNGRQAGADEVASLKAYLERAGASVSLFSEETEIGDVDRIAVLGGDGTVLRAAKRSAELGIPLVGINCGHLGFLTEFERNETEQAAKLLTDESCQALSRSMLEISFGGSSHICLNELALLREVSPDRSNRVESVSVALNGREAGVFAADGLIVATPTGSTAYSLSAGGSILTPDCSVFLLTPICAFSLRSRPIVYSDGDELTLKVAANDVLMAYGDGVFLGEVTASDPVKVKKALRSAVFLTRDRHAFFGRLAGKIN